MLHLLHPALLSQLSSELLARCAEVSRDRVELSSSLAYDRTDGDTNTKNPFYNAELAAAGGGRGGRGGRDRGRGRGGMVYYG